MVDIYKNPELYDAIHQNYSYDKDIITALAKKAGGPVLELAAGTGRLAKCILDLGLDYTGIDSSDSFLHRAIHKYGDQATFLHHDMRQFHLEQYFNFIFIGFNSFLHNLTNEDASQCLQSVRNHLTDNGTFWSPFLFLIHLFCIVKKAGYFLQHLTLTLMEIDAGSWNQMNLIKRPKSIP